VGTARSLVRYAGVNLAHGLIVTGSTAVAAGLIYRRLGDDFGIVALITGGMLRLNLVDDSLGAFLVTAVARRRRGTAPAGAPPATAPGEAAGEIGLAVEAYGLFALLFGLGFAAVAAALLRDRPDVALLAALGGAGLAAATLANLCAKLLEGNEDYGRLRLVQSAVALARLGGLALLAAAAVTAPAAYVAVFAGSFAVLGAALGATTRARLPGALGAWRRADRGQLRPLARFMRPLLVAKGAAVVSYRLDLWIVQALVGTAATAAYAMAEAVAALAAQGLEVLKVVLPVSVARWRGADPAWVRAFVLRTAKASVLLVGTGAVALWAAIDPLLTVWFGAAPPAAVVAARLLLTFYALTSFRSAAQVILVGQGRFGDVEGNFVRAAAINLVASVAATAAWGAWGAALGTLASGVYLLVANLAAAEGALGLPSALLARKLIAPGLLGMAVAALAGAAVAGPAAPGWLLAARAGTAAAVFAASCWWLVLDPDERRWLVRLGREPAATEGAR
jgi:O-antigen/teichoic acid export membrane protein